MGKILMGFLDNPEISYGMKFMNIEHVNEQFMDGWNHFAVLSPFIIKGNYGKNDYSFLTIDGEYKRVDGKWNLISVDNYNFQNIIKEHLSNKLKKIDESLDVSNLKVKIDEFDKDGNKHNKHKVKKVYVKNVLNYANQCQLSIFCNKKVAELLYNIGIGQSTGAGFGTIYKTENHHLYRNKKITISGIKKSEKLSEVA
jgi:CRISPR-associated endoribonuclease Cas6